MKVLLCEDVEKLGFFGDIVDVKPGYARNYLLAQGLGKIASKDNIRSLAHEKAQRAEHRLATRALLERTCEAVNGAEVVVAAAANEQGHLFGSVSGRDVEANLRGQGFEVSDGMLAGVHIREVGTSEVRIRFAPDLSAVVRVVVVSQDELEKASDREEKDEDGKAIEKD
ncbi:MAG: 50S ribosomal protein L9 [Planctomycetota bacterium]